MAVTGRGPVYILVIHRLVVIRTEPIVLAASCTTRAHLRTWSHNYHLWYERYNRAFREITCILVARTSLGILMTMSRSGVRTNPLQRSSVVICVVLILWMGGASSRRLIAHIIHIIMFNRKVSLHVIRRHLVASEMQKVCILQ